MFVVAGVNGNTGRVVAETLLAQGRPLRVVVRQAAKGATWRSRGAETATASLDDSAALTRALEEASGAYLLVPPQYGADDLLAVQRRIAEAMARAVKASDIAHVVLLSSHGAQHAQGTGPVRALHHVEDGIGKAAKNITIVRAAYFLENWAPVLGEAQRSGMLPTFLTPGRAIPMVATADIGRVAAEMLLRPAQGTRIIELEGPVLWSPEDVAQAVSGVLGRDVRVQGVPLDQVVPVFTSQGFPTGTAELFREMYEAINRGHLAREGGRAVLRLGTLRPGEVFGKLLARTTA